MRVKIISIAASTVLWLAAATFLTDPPAPQAESETATTTPAAAASTPVRTLSHRQTVWMHALEWCESQGVQSAINPQDNDGTPSYGAFQFKPSTLSLFALEYEVSVPTALHMPETRTKELVMDYATQRAVIEQMILHRDEINWRQQFPACVDRLGAPPRD